MNESTALYKAIEQAIILPCAEEMNTIPDDNYEFSDTYRKRIDKLIKDRNKSYYPLIKTTLRKTIFIIAAVLMMGTITVAAVPQLREWFIGLFISQNGKNADVLAVQGDIPADDLNDEFIYAEPSFLPNDFSESERIEEPQGLIVYYAAGDKLIKYLQSTIISNNQIDTENKKTEYVSISGCEAFLSYDENSSVIVWNDGSYVYCISGDLCKSDIIAMANSVIPTK